MNSVKLEREGALAVMGSDPDTRYDFNTIEVVRKNDILHVTLANPHNAVNAVDGPMHRELGRLFEQLKNERAARAVVLTGSGTAFSAGGDFAWMREQGPDTLRNLRNEGKQLVWNALDVEVPIVAAVNGPAVGLGATLALLCDVVVMGESATIADPHVKVGLVAGDGGAVLWPMLIGPIQAKRYLLTGSALTGPDAERLGLVTECVPDSELAERAHAWAHRLASGASVAISYTKVAVNQMIKQAMTTAFDYSTALEVLTFVSADHKEALDAMEQKRKPEFQGR
ncbi:enoyl-CoA hydratase/isomerase family protein [Streptomyces sp. NBC_00005]|uniref:enoyl-CoA hydratase/isomerase family protein n=1 Tax=Streptomyces sp. NBC_00005 TaxID=2903609 RepID=UPI003254AE53